MISKYNNNKSQARYPQSMCYKMYVFNENKIPVFFERTS